MALRKEQPDRVPVSPDLYEMVPIRLSGWPSWEVLVYEDPPVWKVRADAHRYYGTDALIPIPAPMEEDSPPAIVYKNDEKVITRQFWEHEGKRVWADTAVVYVRCDASAHVKASTIGLPEAHDCFEVVRKNYTKTGRAYFEDARNYVGEGGVVMPMISLPCLTCWPEDTYAYYENPEAVEEKLRVQGEWVMARLEHILSWKPDAIMIGNSGIMIFNPVPVFRRLCLEWLQKITVRAKECGVLTHLHCCGPERVLVEMAANESDLDAIEPLEMPPMGDCDLKEIKGKFGKKLALKGNLHTTRVMLMGTPEEVREASKKALDDAAEGGGFILSTGDQTPRDTPDANIHAMREVVEKFGVY